MVYKMSLYRKKYS